VGFCRFYKLHTLYLGNSAEPPSWFIWLNIQDPEVLLFPPGLLSKLLFHVEDSISSLGWNRFMKHTFEGSLHAVGYFSDDLALLKGLRLDRESWLIL
jgi:hypothetical protein